jgi:hypothetical protein
MPLFLIISFVSWGMIFFISGYVTPFIADFADPKESERKSRRWQQNQCLSKTTQDFKSYAVSSNTNGNNQATDLAARRIYIAVFREHVTSFLHSIICVPLAVYSLVRLVKRNDFSITSLVFAYEHDIRDPPFVLNSILISIFLIFSKFYFVYQLLR